MKKVIRLTESDLTRIVKRIIRENEEQKITDEVTNIILNNISKEDLLTLGKLYNSIGEYEFKDVAKDVVDSVIEGDTVSEAIGFSKRGITVDTESEKDKLGYVMKFFFDLCEDLGVNLGSKFDKDVITIRKEWGTHYEPGSKELESKIKELEAQLQLLKECRKS